MALVGSGGTVRLGTIAGRCGATGKPIGITFELDVDEDRVGTITLRTWDGRGRPVEVELGAAGLQDLRAAVEGLEAQAVRLVNEGTMVRLKARRTGE
jgi:hypothetical protein